MKWLPIKSYEGMYEVSDTGLIKSLDRTLEDKNGRFCFHRGRLLRLTSNKNVKYLTVHLYRNNEKINKYVHRLVCETFIPNPDNLPEVNHIDGNKLNNVVSNLEWVTREENVNHAIKIGLKIYKTRLNEDQFIAILHRVLNGESYNSLCKELPYEVPWLSTKIREFAKNLGIETELDKALKLQDIERKEQVGKILRDKLSRPIVALDAKTGQEIKRFSSIQEGMKWNGATSSGSISNAANGRQNTAGGYAWKYL